MQSAVYSSYRSGTHARRPLLMCGRPGGVSTSYTRDSSLGHAPSPSWTREIRHYVTRHCWPPGASAPGPYSRVRSTRAVVRRWVQRHTTSLPQVGEALPKDEERCRLLSLPHGIALQAWWICREEPLLDGANNRGEWSYGQTWGGLRSRWMWPDVVAVDATGSTTMAVTL